MARKPVCWSRAIAVCLITGCGSAGTRPPLRTPSIAAAHACLQRSQLDVATVPRRRLRSLSAVSDQAPVPVAELIVRRTRPTAARVLVVYYATRAAATAASNSGDFTFTSGELDVMQPIGTTGDGGRVLLVEYAPATFNQDFRFRVQYCTTGVGERRA